MRRPLFAAMVAASLLIAGGSAVALADIPDTDGTYHVCVSDNSVGGLRPVYLIDQTDTANCPSGSTEKTLPSQSSDPFAGARFQALQEQASCGSPPIDALILVDLPTGTRGIWAQATNGSSLVTSSGQTSTATSVATYHQDSEGRIDGVYIHASGGASCPGTVTANVSVLLYDIEE